LDGHATKSWAARKDRLEEGPGLLADRTIVAVETESPGHGKPLRITPPTPGKMHFDHAGEVEAREPLSRLEVEVGRHDEEVLDVQEGVHPGAADAASQEGRLVERVAEKVVEGRV